MGEGEFKIIQMRRDDNFTYIVYDPAINEAICIDPSNQPDQIIEVLGRKGLELKYIFLTHHHYDHAGGTIDLNDKTGAPIVIHYKEEDSQQANIRVRGGETLEVGSMTIKIMHTPGHTRGSLSILIRDSLFTGDTLFIGYVGRTDLPGGSTRELYSSLQKIKDLSEDTKIYPGHDYGEKPYSDLRTEKQDSVFLRAESVKELANLIRTKN